MNLLLTNGRVGSGGQSEHKVSSEVSFEVGTHVHSQTSRCIALRNGEGSLRQISSSSCEQKKSKNIIIATGT